LRTLISVKIMSLRNLYAYSISQLQVSSITILVFMEEVRIFMQLKLVKARMLQHYLSIWNLLISCPPLVYACKIRTKGDDDILHNLGIGKEI